MKIDFEHIKFIPATLDDYPVIQNMARFYAYDLSEYLGHEDGWEMPENGMYECIDFKKYWEMEGAAVFFIRSAGELAGFIVIDKQGSDASVDFNMAQFFILRKFKNKGLGSFAARFCFDNFRGQWEVRVMPGNEGALQFWRSIISKYTGNKFTEHRGEVPCLGGEERDLFRFLT